MKDLLASVESLEDQLREAKAGAAGAAAEVDTLKARVADLEKAAAAVGKEAEGLRREVEEGAKAVKEGEGEVARLKVRGLGLGGYVGG